jgi:type II secretory pathway pseudopilin PulG
VTNGGRPVQGSAELTPRGSGQGLRRVLSFVWALVPALSFGQLAPIPIIHAAIKLRTWTLWSASALYSAATVLLWSATTTVTSGPVEPAEVSDPPLWTFPLLLGLMVVPTAQALVVRRRVFETKSQQPALAAALQARQRREEAKAIAARDVDLARELRIGRPDLPRQFDDGGLVDLNHVPPPSWSSSSAWPRPRRPRWSRPVTTSVHSSAPRRSSPIPTSHPRSSTAFASGWYFSPEASLGDVGACQDHGLCRVKTSTLPSLVTSGDVVIVPLSLASGVVACRLVAGCSPPVCRLPVPSQNPGYIIERRCTRRPSINCLDKVPRFTAGGNRICS